MASSNGINVSRSPQVMVADIDWGILATAETVTLGYLPAGSYFTIIRATVTEAFDSGTSDVLEIGTGAYGSTSADVDSIEDTTNLQSAGVVTMTYVIKPLTIISADYAVPITATYTAVGTQSTSGECRIALEFIQP